ncbi:MAG: hypothetical protein ABT01_03820 [Clostridium sp. SCN 57-10]|nr:MAG: hypothetical protein ABT01_03820 [Clostridium sp. SCN 57-10]
MAKKRKSPLLLLLVLLVLCVGALLGVRAYNAAQAKKEAQDAENAKIIIIPKADYHTVQVKNSADTFSLLYADERWTLAEDESFPLDQSKTARLTDIASGLTAITRITNGDTLEAYGLASPAATLTLTGETETITVMLGDPDNGHSYLKRGGDDAVYEIAGDLLTQASLGRLNLISPDLLPTLTAANITGFSVMSGNGILTLVRETVDKTDHWYIEQDGTRIAASNEKLAVPLSSLTTLTINGCAAYRPDAAALASFGLDAPRVLTVSYSAADNQAHTLVLEVGDKTADGANYFVHQQGSDYVDLLSVSALDTILTLERAALQ